MKAKKFCPYCMNPVLEGEACGNCGLTEGNYTPAIHHLPLGTVLIDRYMVGRVLGEGGFGITYIGCDLRLELKVAIKEYFPSDKASRYSQVSLEVQNYTGLTGNDYEKGKEKFLNEARTMAKMDKQAEIVGVRDYFDANNTAYIVMEYVEGTTFKTLVEQKGGRIPPDELFGLLKPLFPALNNMHALGLIHRDISPDNLMLEKGAVRLLDFGCARESSYGAGTLTVMVKHGYAPIEQYQHKGQGPWTDVYALSATIYYCLTGKVPEQAVDRLYEDELVPPRKLGVQITEQQERALLYGMGIRQKARFQSIEELYAALYLGGNVPVAEQEKSSADGKGKNQRIKKAEKNKRKTGQSGRRSNVDETDKTLPAEYTENESIKEEALPEEMPRDVGRQDISSVSLKKKKHTPKSLLTVTAIFAIILIAGLVFVLIKLPGRKSVWSNSVKQPSNEKVLKGLEGECGLDWYPPDSLMMTFNGRNKDYHYLSESEFGPGDVITVYFDRLEYQNGTWFAPIIVLQSETSKEMQDCIYIYPKVEKDSEGKNKDDKSNNVNLGHNIAQFSYEEIAAKAQEYWGDNWRFYVDICGIASPGVRLFVNSVSIGEAG